jgi:hypothetical protein
LAHNTTAICQPIDRQWVVDSWDEEEDFVVYNEKKKKYKVKKPKRSLVIEWILKAYNEIKRETILKSKPILFYYH